MLTGHEKVGMMPNVETLLNLAALVTVNVKTVVVFVKLAVITILLLVRRHAKRMLRMSCIILRALNM
jgi:hypothetical protein